MNFLVRLQKSTLSWWGGGVFGKKLEEGKRIIFLRFCIFELCLLTKQHHSAASDMLLSLMRLRGSQYVQNPGAPPPIDDIPPAKSPGAKIGVILKEKYADLLVSRVTTKVRAFGT